MDVHDDAEGQTQLWSLAARGDAQLLVDWMRERSARVPTLQVATDGANRPVFAAADSSGMTPLMHAANGGHAGALRALLGERDAHATVNALSQEGWSALHYACRAASRPDGDVDAVRALLEAGAYVNLPTTDDKELTALHIAAEENADAVVELLLGAGAEVNVANKDWRNTPLLCSLWRSSCTIDVVRRLLSAGADVHARNATGASAIHVCTTGESEDIVDLLVRCGANVNSTAEQRDVDDPDGAIDGGDGIRTQAASGDLSERTGKRPLHYYIKHGGRHTPIVAALLRHGADPNALDADNLTPIELLDDMRPDDRTLREMLVAAGARDWRTPLDVAIDAGDLNSVVAAIAENPAGVNIERKADVPLIRAMRTHRADIVEALVRAGANIYSVGRGSSPMSVALNEGDVDVVRVLLDVGGCSANHAIMDDEPGRDHDGFTLLHWVCDTDVDYDYQPLSEGEGGEWGCLCQRELSLAAMAELLLARGARVNARDVGGMTPLHHAASRMCAALVRLLLHAGADPLARSSNGETPVSLLARFDETMRGDVPEHERLFSRLRVNSATGSSRGFVFPSDADEGADSDSDSDASDICELVRDWKCRATHLEVEDYERLYRGLRGTRAALSPFADSAQCPLRDAILAGDAGRVRALLVGGESAVYPDTCGRRPLYHACRAGDADIVGALIDAGASPTRDCAHSISPLHVAALYGHADVVKLLFGLPGGDEDERGSPSKPRAIHAAVVSGSIDVVDAVLASGANPDAPPPYETVCVPLWPILLAAMLGRGDIVLRLHAAGASIFGPWGGGRTLLHFARAGAVDPLLSLGVAFGARDDDGRTALHLSARRGDDLAVSALLRVGLEVNERDAKGRTPLHYARCARRARKREGGVKHGERFGAFAGASHALAFASVVDVLRTAGGVE
eukprot:Opistho-1_new@70073